MRPTQARTEMEVAQRMGEWHEAQIELAKAEARIRRNNDMDVGTVQASTPPPAQEAPPSECAWAPE
eukprot:10746621-Alexandrium_andersonii.AAC.1